MSDTWISPDEALERVHDFLKRPFWPEHLVFGSSLCLPTPDHSGSRESGDVTIDILSAKAIRVSTERQVPDPEHRPSRMAQEYSRVVRRTDNPLVFQATVALALAFRLDRHAYKWGKSELKELEGTSDPRLESFYGILGCLPWLPSLVMDSYEIPGDLQGNDCSYGAAFTLMNDSYLCIGYTHERVYQNTGGGIYPHVLSALQILAEAIRLENEGRG
jgi:hypothetical protein